jgi:hypothetical protein
MPPATPVQQRIDGEVESGADDAGGEAAGAGDQ